MQWKKLLNSDRLKRPKRKRPPELHLNPFFEDQDRIVFSQPFRRMQAKTQVHPLCDNDHVRTRLTHSSEVATIGFVLGYGVGKDLKKHHRLGHISEYDFGLLVQAACLAHDIGNPPFGHAGEEAIRDWFIKNGDAKGIFSSDMTDAECNDFRKFEGNAQGFRILTQIENYKSNGGMQLTYSTLAAYMKYPWDSNIDPLNKGKFSYFQSEKKYAELVASNLGLIPQIKGGWCRHPLTYLVEAADDICYAVIDLEDGIEMGSYSIKEYINQFQKYIDTNQRKKDYRSFNDDVQRISFLRAKAITRFVEQSIRAFINNEDKILKGEFNKELLDEIKEAEFVRKAKKLAYQKVFEHEKKLYLEVAAYPVISGLLEHYVNACIFKSGKSEDTKNRHLISLMGRMKPKSSDTRYEKLLKVTDFISGMTDRFAVGMYRQLQGITTGSLTPAPNVQK